MSEHQQDPAYQYNPNNQYGTYPGKEEQGPQGVNQAYTTPNSNQPPSYSQYMGYGNANFHNAPAPEKPALPVTVKTGVFITYALLAITLITSIFQVFNIDSIMEQTSVLDNSADLDYLNDSGSFLTAIAGFSLAVSAIFIAVEVLFAVFAYRGANWARIVLTIILGLKVLDLVAVPFSVALLGWMNSYIVSLFIGLLALVALICLWLKPSNAYYAAMKIYKQWQEFNR